MALYIPKWKFGGFQVYQAVEVSIEKDPDIDAIKKAVLKLAKHVDARDAVVNETTQLLAAQKAMMEKLEEEMTALKQEKDAPPVYDSAPVVKLPWWKRWFACWH